MDLSTFIENFADQFEETDPSEITAETNFRDLEEWSSLIGYAIVSMVDEEYGRTLNPEQLRRAQTVGELFEIVKAL